MYVSHFLLYFLGCQADNDNPELQKQPAVQIPVSGASPEEALTPAVSSHPPDNEA